MSESRSLTNACEDLLSFTMQLRAAAQTGGGGEPESAEALQQQVDGMLLELQTKANTGGINSKYTDTARYAIVALIDEVVLNSHWGIREEWMGKPLQLRYFNEFTAGQGFFDKLQALRASTDPVRFDVLEVYSLCLGIGFKGRHADLAGVGILEALRSEIAREIRAGRGETSAGLAANWRPEEQLQQSVSKVPVWVFAAACGGVVLLLWLMFDFLLGWDADNFLSRFQVRDVGGKR